MRRSLALGLALLTPGCSPSGPLPHARLARFVVGTSDTFTIHSRRPVQLPIRALDAAGREVVSPPVTTTRLAGDSIPVSPSGSVTCHSPGTALVGVSGGGMLSQVLVRCRPVRSVRMAGPLDILLGDSSHRLRPEVLGLDDHSLDPGFVGSIEIMDRSIVKVEGDRVIPRAAGFTLLTFTVGDESATVSVHVYRAVVTLEGLGPGQDHVAVPVQLQRGASRRWPLPAGSWMITMQPNDHLPDNLLLDMEGAGCESMSFPKGRILCQSNGAAHLRISLPLTSRAAALSTMLLLRRTTGKA